MTNIKQRGHLARRTGAGERRTMLATRDLSDFVKSVLWGSTVKEIGHCSLDGESLTNIHQLPL